MTLTATATAERYGIPFVIGDSVAANITGRGFKWFFRTTPVASDFAANYMTVPRRHEGERRQGR